jgi:hypothetical protein
MWTMYKRVPSVKYWLVLLLLAGCGAKLARDMNTGLQKFVGQDVKVAIDTLGLPSGKFSLDDQEVYVWSTSHLEGGSAWGTGAISDNSCVVRLGVGADRKVTRFTWDGGRACSLYNERLNP